MAPPRGALGRTHRWLSLYVLMAQRLVCLHAFLPRSRSRTVPLPRSVGTRREAPSLTTSSSPPGVRRSTPLGASSPRGSSHTPQSLFHSRSTGGLRRLPVVHPPQEMVNRAQRQSLRIRPDATLRNARLRARKHAAERITALQQALCLPLRDLVKGYQYEWRRLHPFERVVADLTARARQRKDGLTLHTVLDDVHEARKIILDASKDWIAKAKSADTAREANDAMAEATEQLVQLFQQFAAPSVAGMVDLQRSLRTAPIVKLDAPAVVLVGAPNVGKSSIVRAISSATPEVNNYPFTTRGMTLGHVTVEWEQTDLYRAATILQEESVSQQCQVMDSPGLLVRDQEADRNEMEALTMAALQHLPTAVLYVVDLSGLAGDQCSSIEDQLTLRKQVRQRFPNRPWFDVVSKVDLGMADGALDQYERILDGSPYIQLSIQQGQGTEQLRKEVVRMLGEVKVVLDAMAVQASHAN